MENILCDSFVNLIVENTYKLFEDCQMRYKKVIEVKLEKNINGSRWGGLSATQGKIVIDVTTPKSDYGCIAHELAHGSHEAERKNDVEGEDYAEAIRYFLENKHYITDSTWRLNTKEKIKDTIILNICSWDYDKFKKMCEEKQFKFCNFKTNIV